MQNRYSGNFLIQTAGHSDSFAISEAFLQRIEQLYPSFRLMDKASSFFFIFDFVKAKYLYVSESIASILGYTAEEWKERGVDFAFSIVHHEDVNRLMACHKTMFDLYYATPIEERKDMRYGYEVRVVSKDGRVVWLLQQGVFLEIDVDGRPVISFDVLSDLTHYKKNNVLTLSLSKADGSSPQVVYFPLQARVSFSKREIEILHMLERTMTSKAIAETLCISQHTVDTHRRNMIKKANVRDTSQLVSFARDNGLINI